MEEKKQSAAEALQAIRGWLSELGAFQCSEGWGAGDGCKAAPVVELENLKTGQRWRFCAEHAPKEAPPRCVLRPHTLGRVLDELAAHLAGGSK